MNRIITVNNMVLSREEPRVCSPAIGTSLEEVLWEIRSIKEKAVDIIEWRADYFKEDIFHAISKIRKEAGETPVLFTYRTKPQGGRGNEQDYEKLVEKAIHSKIAMVDIEFCAGESSVKKLVEVAKERGVASVVSAHFFETAPKGEELQGIYNKIEELGGDIPKIAIMPKDFFEVLEFMETALRVSLKNSPIIAIAMGNEGSITRLCPAQIGSCLSFAAGKLASAPGQLKPELVKAAVESYKK